jgi:colicin import membrane protein
VSALEGMSRPGDRLSRPRDRWISIALSVLLHGALLAALVYGWLLFRQPPRPAPTLAIEGRVVDARAMRGTPTPPPPQPPPPATVPQSVTPPEPVGPPQPTPEELAQREQQRQQAEQAAAQARQAAEQKAAQEKAEKAAAEQAAAEQAAKVAAERKAAEARAAAQRQAQERAQRLADAQEASEAQADLKRSLAAEQANAVRSGPALANWQSLISAKIKSNWFRPPTARSGIECTLYVTQVPGGEVTQVRIGECNGDQAVRQSIEDAVYRASPLPPPPDPSLFDRNLKIDFRPD